jgi:hypothetical protein
MLGYCGIYCHNCSAYRGTVTRDMSLLEKVADKFGDGAYSAKDWICLGCQPADQLFLAKFCAKCGIRTCAIKKKVQNCAACDEFENCSKLHDFINAESEEIVWRMKSLRERFLDRQSPKDV